ncbi:MAG: regulatory protein RecX [Lachnospiraceae bacterium]|nr:regulatory protein RecX [Lachnospiraceae bacterium]
MEYVIRLVKTGGKKIYVDPGETEGIYLYPGEIKKLHLTEGCRITPEELEEARKSYALPRARHRAIAVLAKRDKTEQELRAVLYKSGTDSRSLEETIQYVKNCGYVDDLEYARDYLSFKKRKKSFLQIRMELKRKGISDEILEEVFEEEGSQQVESLFPAMKKYAEKYSELDYTAKQKIYGHFARKGYDSSLIRETITEVERCKTEKDSYE